MGGLFHFFDLNQSTMARKIHAHKRHVDGFEAPRNSLELQVEASQSCSTARDGVVEEDLSKKNCYPLNISMKRLINEEISQQSNTRKNAPSIVARLMGVDMLPIDTKSAVQQAGRRNGTKHERSSSGDLSSKSNHPRKVELFESLNEYKESRDIERWDNGEQLGRPRPREHPQEEELQKFKKEFEAWQASRFKECSKVVKLDRSPCNLLEKENINKQKVGGNSISGITDKPVLKQKYNERARHHTLELFPDEQKGYISSRNSSIDRNYEAYPTDYDESFAPKRIVILKPGPDRICDPEEESWPSSSCTIEERGSIEDFLEEVKERLKSELQGKSHKRSSGVRGSGIETPFSEKPSDPKQIARHIAKHVRDSVTRDLGRNLLRSESTRSYGSEIPFNGPDSPQFINRNTRRFLSERLRNVLKREKHSQDVPFAISGSFFSGNNAKIMPKDEEQEMKSTRSFRHGDDDLVINREPSPRNLVRSLSAPVSGTSFGKLLLEDRHVLTGAHIRRKHEALEKNVKMDHLRKRKKERFNIKEKVSNFRYNLTLQGKLFGKKLQSMVDQSHGCEHDFVKDIMSGPTVVRNLSERRIMENSTEVPPSPASICSSAQEDFWRPMDCSSPFSTYDVTPAEDSAMPQVFREISSNLNELRRQLNQLESNEPDNNSSKMEPDQADDFAMVELEDKVEAYTRDLLVASGLYDGSFDSCLSRYDPLAKPISKSVFEKLEKKHSRENEKDQNDHKMVYDLLNEALAMLLGPPVTMSRFRRKIISSSFQPPLCGQELLKCVWKMMKVYLNPPPQDHKSHYSLDSMVAKNLETSPWSGLIENEINGLGKEIESEIIGDLVQEILTDFIPCTTTNNNN